MVRAAWVRFLAALEMTRCVEGDRDVVGGWGVVIDWGVQSLVISTEGRNLAVCHGVSCVG